jgi:predicted nucleic-acid-binding protein
MSKTRRYAVNPESVEAYRIRVLFHCEELQRETQPAIRATIALYLAEAATTLARLEVEEAQKESAAAYLA